MGKAASWLLFASVFLPALQAGLLLIAIAWTFAGASWSDLERLLLTQNLQRMLTLPWPSLLVSCILSHCVADNLYIHLRQNYPLELLGRVELSVFYTSSRFISLNSGLRLAEQLGRREDEAKIRHGLGLSLWASGNLEEAQHQVSRRTLFWVDFVSRSMEDLEITILTVMTFIRRCWLVLLRWGTRYPAFISPDTLNHSKDLFTCVIDFSIISLEFLYYVLLFLIKP